MPYTTLAPTLAALSAVKSNPTDSETFADVYSLSRQTRAWLVDFLKTKFTVLGGENVIRLSALANGSFSAASIKGTNPATSEERQIKQFSIGEKDFALKSLDESRFANHSLAGRHFSTANDLRIDGTKFKAGSISGECFGNFLSQIFTIDSTALADSAVRESNFVNLNVLKQHVSKKSLNGSVLAKATNPQTWLIGGQRIGNDGNNLGVRETNLPFDIDKDGVATLSEKAVGFAILREESLFSSAWSVVPSTWQSTQGASRWKVYDQSDNGFLTIEDPKIHLNRSGNYLFLFSVPAYQTDGVATRVRFYLQRKKTNGTIELFERVFYFSSGYSAAASGITVRQKLIVLQTTNNLVSPPCGFRIEQKAITSIGSNKAMIFNNPAFRPVTEAEYGSYVLILKVN